MSEQINTEFPYERFEHVGAHALTDAELIAIILRTGTVGEDALTLAHRILSLTSGRNTGILALNSIPIEELMQIKGIGKVKAIRLKCVAEICARMQTRSREDSLSFQDPASIAGLYMERMRIAIKIGLSATLDTRGVRCNKLHVFTDQGTNPPNVKQRFGVLFVFDRQIDVENSQ